MRPTEIEIVINNNNNKTTTNFCNNFNPSEELQEYYTELPHTLPQLLIRHICFILFPFYLLTIFIL